MSPQPQGSLLLPLEPDEYAHLALDVPLYNPFTYRIPAHLKPLVQPGMRVLVPFRGKAQVGLVLERNASVGSNGNADKILDVGDVLDTEPVVAADVVELLRWMASYYFCPLGEAIKLALPSALRVAGRRLFSITDVGRRALEARVVQDPLHVSTLDLLVAANQPVEADELRARLRGLTYLLLAQLEQAQWVTSHYEADDPKVSVKIEKWITLRRDPYVDEALGDKQAQIVVRLQALDFGEPVRLEDLKQEVFQPTPALKSLEKRGIISIEEREAFRDPFADATPIPPADREATPDQAQALGVLRAQLAARQFKTFLLHGVTGSGKTEVYVRLIRDANAQGRSALILLPEISLTPQFVAVFRGYFGDQIAVLHSGLSLGQRYDAWRRLRSGDLKIAIGARSALFAPLQDLGVIIVDEEHDHSFKQESGCRYHARDMAQMRGRASEAVVVLGSATPSIETYFNARKNRIGYLPMASRVAERQLPAVEIVDMRSDGKPAPTLAADPGADALTPQLMEALAKTLDASEQAILFLNRRGFSPFVQCGACGLPMQCRDCSVSLTYHRRPHRLRCHYCDHSIPMPSKCPRCGAEDLKQLGAGTERLEAALKHAFPDARIGRLDRDTGYGSRMATVIQRFRAQELDILLGTQMVTKGHDFHNVTLVGVILADLGLNFPDFRAGERTFQLLAQVSGRAGRGEKLGRVIIQTYSPWHYALDAARHHSYSEFVKHELQIRSELSYPPFSHLAAVLFEGADEDETAKAAHEWAHDGKALISGHERWRAVVSLLGPAQAPLAKLRGKSRWQLLLKGKDRAALRGALTALLEARDYFNPRNLSANVKIVVDVDPQNML
jgi:primosomal protein N' (replication factor Y)